MGKTPGKWIKTLLLGKKSPKSNLANGSENLRSAKNKKEEPVVSVTDEFSNLSVDPSVVSSVPDAATTAQNVVSPNNDAELELEHDAIKVQAAFRGHQARRAFRTLKGIIRLQAVIRGHLVRRQAVATYSCIFGIVKFQALVRGQKARSSDNGMQCQKLHKEAGDASEALQMSTYSWMNNPTKFVFVDRLLASSPAALPLKIQYGPEEPNAAKVWLERWTQLQVWSPASRAAEILVPKSKTKKRNYEEVAETEKARPKRGVKKQSGRNIGNGSNRSTTISEKPKRNVRKTSGLSNNPTRTESDKTKQNSRNIKSSSKEGSPLEVKDEKPKPKVKRSSLSNGSEKTTRKSAEKKKDTTDSVKIKPQVKVEADVFEGGFNVESVEKKEDIADYAKIKPEVKAADVLEEGDAIESVEKEKDIAHSVQMEPEVKVSDVPEEEFNAESVEKKKETADPVLTEPEVKVLEGENTVEPAEKEKYTTNVVHKVLDVETEEISVEQDEPRAVETNDNGEDLKCSDVKESSENGNLGSDSTKPKERRASLSAIIDSQDDGIKHSGRKTPSYMAPTASAKARLKGESSPRFVQEKTETLRRLSLASPANGKLTTTTTTMSPRAEKLLVASAKGSMNGVKSFTSSKDISDKSTRTKWKR